MNDFRFVVGGRFWGPNEEAGNKVKLFIERALDSGAERVLVAINEDSDKSGVLSRTWPDQAEVFGVRPWGKFTPALNAVLGMARKDIVNGASLLFASIEVNMTPEIISNTASQFDNNTLCVGARLEGHDFDLDKFEHPFPADGRQIPWNTFTLWNPNHLWKTGFPNIGNGVVGEEKNAGVEELCTMALIQHLFGAEKNKVKLIQIPDIEWATNFEDAERQAKHEAKMKSKVERPAKQLNELGLDAPMVQHIVVD